MERLLPIRSSLAGEETNQSATDNQSSLDKQSASTGREYIGAETHGEVNEGETAGNVMSRSRSRYR